jgi:hypothetical protein
MLCLRFVLNEAIWNTVVRDSNVPHCVVEENSDAFTVEYQSQEDADSEIVRYDGRIAYMFVDEPQ